MGPLDDSYDLALAASSLRSNSSDVHALLKALCAELSDTLGERLHVERAGGRLHKSDAIASVHITLGPDAFEAVIEGSVACAAPSGTSSGGIRIRSETVDVDQWIVRLLAP